MHSTEKTYYNLKRLHVVFAVASSALLAVTVWMVAADHDRPWKRYQRTFRDRIEPWMTAVRIDQQQTAEFRAREEELAAALEKARRAVPQRGLIERFRAEVETDAAGRHARAADFDDLRRAYEELAAEPTAAARDALLAQLRRFLAAGAFRQENAQRRLRFRRAELDEARSYYEAGVGEGLPQKKLTGLQRQVDAAAEDVRRLAAASEDAATHCAALEQILGEITAEEDAARRARADHRATLDRLQRTLARQRPSGARRVLRGPLIDALGRPLAIRQIWLPELTIDYHFRRVARFDRCVTCHQGIDKTQPGRPAQPAFRPEEVLTVQLPRPKPEQAKAQAAKQRSLEHVYGLVLAEQGILDRRAATVGRVVPETPAARAGLIVGDVILSVDKLPVRSRDDVRRWLLDEVRSEPPFDLEIRRGLPHPYCSHPRPDLYVGAASPHPMAEFGCTICHDGQGSATDFKWVSHTPNGPGQRARWRQQHDWFRNRDWDLPMLPARFAESRCLKCHHVVTDLEPSPRFPDPPAPKLLAGYQLVRQSGCFGCHEIKGVDDAGRSVGPDVRLEPNYHEAALRLLADPGLTGEQRRLARQIIALPEDPEARRRLVASIRAQRAAGSATPSRLNGRSYAMVELLAAEQPAPGTMYKVGPSLHDVSDRLGTAVLVDKLRNPDHFRLRPNTLMPTLFGMHDHLDGRVLADTRRFEEVEIRAIAEYLGAASRPTESLDPPPGVTEEPSPEEGRRLFEIRGCLACHKHRDFDKHQPTQGPDLSDSFAKYTAEKRGAWLAAWIRDPARHFRRTLMPNVQLEPIPVPGAEEVDETGRPSQSGSLREGTLRMRDPAADVAAYLLLPPPEPKPADTWKPLRVPPPAELEESDLDELALLHLTTSFPRKLAQKYLREGIPESMAEQVPVDAKDLLGRMTHRKKIRYLGRRTIRKRGCYGCHDVPGFEDAQPIGPALSDWGRKQESLLAFEQINPFIKAAATPAAEPPGAAGSAASGTPGSDSDHGFYLRALLAHRREGFLWQKLRAPRSFDYKKAQNKDYNQQLKMGRFPLSDEQIEAIATFVLGLVADPPAEKYAAGPPERRHASLAAGRRLFEESACSMCHTMEMERWRLTFDIQKPEGFFQDLNLPLPVEDFDFLQRNLGEEAVEALEAAVDSGGMYHAKLTGMPKLDANGEFKTDEYEDDDGNSFDFYTFTLWQPATVDGRPWSVGGQVRYVLKPNDRLKEYRLEKKPPVGGAFARLLYPVALAAARRSGAIVNPNEEDQAWGWVPPPLLGEGGKVRRDWLGNYLLEPYAIRPALLLRMPKFNLSAAEANRLAEYVATVTGTDAPDRSQPDPRPPTPAEKQRRRRMDDALRIVQHRRVDCASCHRIGDYSPGEEIKATLAPNLEQVGGRLRPGYLRRWLANPKAVLPYTRMTRNFDPTQPPFGQDLFPATPLEQLDALTDLLSNYPWYMGRRFEIQAD